MVGEAKSGFAGAGIHLAIGLGTAAAFVSAEADSDHRWMRGVQLRGFAKYFFSFVEREVPDGIKDPVEGKAEFAFGAKAGTFEPGEDGVEAIGIGIAPVIDDSN